MLMGLRLREGVDLDAMAARFGLTGAELCDPAKAAFYERQGLVRREGARLHVTEEGMPLLDGLLGEIVPVDLVGP